MSIEFPHRPPSGAAAEEWLFTNSRTLMGVTELSEIPSVQAFLSDTANDKAFQVFSRTVLEYLEPAEKQELAKQALVLTRASILQLCEELEINPTHLDCLKPLDQLENVYMGRKLRDLPLYFTNKASYLLGATEPKEPPRLLDPTVAKVADVYPDMNERTGYETVCNRVSMDAPGQSEIPSMQTVPSDTANDEALQVFSRTVLEYLEPAERGELLTNAIVPITARLIELHENREFQLRFPPMYHTFVKYSNPDRDPESDLLPIEPKGRKPLRFLISAPVQSSIEIYQATHEAMHLITRFADETDEKMD